MLKFDLEQIDLSVKKGLYKYIGSGSGRKVFDLGNGYALKVAVNRKGFAQNGVESQISSYENSDIFAKVLQVSDNYKLLIMEKADKIKSMSEVWKFYNVKNNKELFHIEKLKFISINYNLLLQDLCRSQNWGMINERPVIVDYGFTRAVKKKYY